MTGTGEKSFYIAVLLYESTTSSGDKKPLYQESFVLLQATNAEEARSLALEHARQQETQYQNPQGEVIHWRLRQLVDVNPVLDEELKHGSELYARHFRNYDAYHAFEPLLGGTVD